MLNWDNCYEKVFHINTVELRLKGPVSIKENQGKLKEKRYIFLFNDCFLLTKIRQTNPNYFSKSNNFRYKTCVRLDSFPSPSIAEDFVSSGREF